MKECRSCGTQVEDKEYICPCCGAEVLMKSNLSLKAADPAKKKKDSSMGTFVSTGSGLTELLKREDGTDFNSYEEESGVLYGSMPLNSHIDEEDYSSKKKNNSAVYKAIFKLLLLAAAAFGIYMLLTKVIFKETGAKSYEQAIDIYIEALNNQDKEKMTEISTKYNGTASENAEKLLSGTENIHISDYTINQKVDYTREDIKGIQDSIKMDTGKTVNFRSGATFQIKFKATVDGTSKNYVQELDIVKIDDKYYIRTDNYEVFRYRSDE